MNLFSCGCLKKFHTESTHESVMVSYCEEHKPKDFDAPKPFDITKHEWGDCDVLMLRCNPHSIAFQNHDDNVYFERRDAIAIAKHFNLTAEDLK